MTITKINKITIVGGGTSAWLTAAYFNHNAPPGIEIVIIDKENGSPIGVGEATILSFKNFMDDCGIGINEWFDVVDATFKSGILFTNWHKEGEDIWHPFCFPYLGIFQTSMMNQWTKHQHYDFKTYASALYEASVFDNNVDPDNLGAYAFHIDCGKLVKFLQERLISGSKVSLIKSEVVDVNFNGDYLENIVLADGTVVSSSLFIDCTGFKRIISPKLEPYNLRDRLFCDTAVAGHIPYNNIDDERKPYVTCEAVEHGWIWNIPVRNRIGSGLVFNRSVTDPEEAKDYFISHWDNRLERDSLKLIDWTPYYHEHMWKGNVTSIGLSAGFIEPLESTGVALICAGIWELGKPIKTGFFSDTDCSIFNTQMKVFFEDSIDFVNLHYWNTQRSGRFWDWVKETYKTTERLESYVDHLKTNPYTLPTQGQGKIFSGENWSTWLCQLGFEICRKEDGISNKHSEELIMEFYKNEVEKRKTLIHHSKFIEQFSNMLGGWGK
jgi:tryptophan halogenase